MALQVHALLSSAWCCCTAVHCLPWLVQAQAGKRQADLSGVQAPQTIFRMVQQAQPQACRA